MAHSKGPSYASLVDVTDFGTILRYYDSPTSDISQVVLVEPSVLLHDVAAATATLSTAKESRTLMSEWVQTRSFRNLSDEKAGELLFSRDEVDADQAVKCIFLPPVYLIQLHESLT